MLEHIEQNRAQRREYNIAQGAHITGRCRSLEILGYQKANDVGRQSTLSVHTWGQRAVILARVEKAL